MSDDADELSNELLALRSIFEEAVVVTGPSTVRISVDVTLEHGDRAVLDCRAAQEIGLEEAIVAAGSPCEDPAARDSEEPLAAPVARDPRQMVHLDATTPPPPPTDETSVKHLPPMTVEFMFPADYPSVRPPAVAITCLWLSPSDLATLRERLAQQWADEGSGSTCVFQWVETLRAWGRSQTRHTEPHVLASLRAASRRVVCTGHESIDLLGLRADDGRVRVHVESRAHLAALLSHDWQADERMWHECVLTCPICLEETTGAQCVRGMRPGCAHAACRSCLRAMVAAATESSDVDEVRCVVADCRAPMPAALIADVAGEALYTRWAATKRERLMLSLPGLCYCPRCDPASADYKARHAKAKTEPCKFFASFKGCAT
jgi:hypothetical protein